MLWFVTHAEVGNRPYPFKFFKGCLPQILLALFLKILSHISLTSSRRSHRRWNVKKVFFLKTLNTCKRLFLTAPNQINTLGLSIVSLLYQQSCVENLTSKVLIISYRLYYVSQENKFSETLKSPYQSSWIYLLILLL